MLMMRSRFPCINSIKKNRRSVQQPRDMNPFKGASSHTNLKTRTMHSKTLHIDQCNPSGNRFTGQEADAEILIHKHVSSNTWFDRNNSRLLPPRSLSQSPTCSSDVSDNAVRSRKRVIGSTKCKKTVAIPRAKQRCCENTGRVRRAAALSHIKKLLDREPNRQKLKPTTARSHVPRTRRTPCDMYTDNSHKRRRIKSCSYERRRNRSSKQPYHRITPSPRIGFSRLSGSSSRPVCDRSRDKCRRNSYPWCKEYRRHANQTFRLVRDPRSGVSRCCYSEERSPYQSPFDFIPYKQKNVFTEGRVENILGQKECARLKVCYAHNEHGNQAKQSSSGSYSKTAKRNSTKKSTRHCSSTRSCRQGKNRKIDKLFMCLVM